MSVEVNLSGQSLSSLDEVEIASDTVDLDLSQNYFTSIPDVLSITW